MTRMYLLGFCIHSKRSPDLARNGKQVDRHTFQWVADPSGELLLAELHLSDVLWSQRNNACQVWRLHRPETTRSWKDVWLEHKSPVPTMRVESGDGGRARRIPLDDLRDRLEGFNNGISNRDREGVGRALRRNQRRFPRRCKRPVQPSSL